MNMIVTNTLAHARDDALVQALRGQLDLFGTEELIALQPATPNVYFDAPDIDLSVYDRAIVCLSGGKDSIACLLHLLELGFPPVAIELWHHPVDAFHGETFADWPFMDSFNEQLAEAYSMPLYNSWLGQGFKGELLKNKSKPKSHFVQTPDGLLELTRDRAKEGTRRRFPQQAADLRTRYCSSVLKIDVARRALTAQQRFLTGRTLFITGERRDESPGRSRYNQLEPHHCDTARSGRSRKARFVDTWRPVLHWSEERVWDIIQRAGLVAPLPYRLNWGRSSCQICIFNSDKLWATMAHYWPERVQEIAELEREFGVSIARNGLTVLERAAAATPFDDLDPGLVKQAAEREYRLPLFVPEGQSWELPRGAFSQESAGAA